MNELDIKKLYNNDFLKDELLDNYFNEMMNYFLIYNSNLADYEKIHKAYDLAKSLHKDVRRKSGELYMYHPLRVAMMAVSYNMDATSICTALLHDVIEDTDYTYENMEENFGQEIAKNVDCVTKITKADFNTSNFDLYVKTVSKLFRYLAKIDIRGPIIKLFDRLDNMRTIEAMKPEKQLEKSKQTLEIFAPIAYAIGANQLKKELQNLAFPYVKKDKYEYVKAHMDALFNDKESEIAYILNDLHNKFNQEGIENIIKLRVKDLYNTFISLKKGRTLDTIHDLYALQISLNEKIDCFMALNTIHENYRYLDDKFKDYINNPKTTGYRALHSTIITNNELMLQAQIRTKNMAVLNSKGLIYKLSINSLSDLEQAKKGYPFFQTVEEIDRDFKDDRIFYEKLKYEVLGQKIYVRSGSGKVYALPVGANIIDFAFLACGNRAAYLNKAFVNGEEVENTYPLKNQDLVTFTSGNEETIDRSWIDDASTSIARRLILERINKRGQ